MKKSYLLSILFILNSGFINCVYALNIFNENPSFENHYLVDGSGTSDISGWEVVDLPGDGIATLIINPTFADFFEYQVDGRNVLFASYGEVTYQRLSAVLEANKTYTLTVLVGHKKSPFIGYPGFYFDDYAVQLYAGDTLLVEESSLQPAEREFLTSTSTYIAYSDDPLLGEQLEIRLMAIGKMAGFDNVRLEVTTNLDPVRIEGAIPLYFSTLQTAYDQSINENIIQSKSLVFSETLYIDENKSLIFLGGYNHDYTYIDGKTTVNGSMIINDGFVVIENFTLE